MRGGAVGKVIAGCFALASFAVALFAGIVSDNPAMDVLIRALVAMLVCYPIGLLVGMVCEHIVQAHVAAHRAANPPPESSEQLRAAASTGASDEDVIVV
jgi:hypothetical protein